MDVLKRADDWPSQETEGIHGARWLIQESQRLIDDMAREISELRARIEWDDWLVEQIRESSAAGASKGSIVRSMNGAIKNREQHIKAMVADSAALSGRPEEER